ncbi:TonB-dependent receptor [Chitinivorax sp. B]|uniref:TonB-dependent receptor domain-containing protein n=1 Tax=Chitinivorax sp. B TaxID=2502235 RepID=UPI001484E788|nr:TonB-dependent receptor [Chitinivorax sp. B]
MHYRFCCPDTGLAREADGSHRRQIACLIGMVVATQAWAASTQHRSEESEAMVVTATRTRTLLYTTPAAISRLDEDDLATRQAQSIGDVLQDIPGVAVGGGPRVAGRLPSLRGFTGKQITILVDGARMNEAAGLTTPVLIDPWLLADAEVLRGSGSALYGSGGLGGVISLRTMTARELLGKGQSWGGEIQQQWDQADASQVTRARGYGYRNGLDLLAGISRRDWGEIRQGGGTRLSPNTGHAGQGVIRTGYELIPDGHISINHRRYQEQSTRPNNPQADMALGNPGLVPVQHNHIDQTQTGLAWVQKDAQGDPVITAQLYRTMLETRADANPEQFLPASNSLTQTEGVNLQYVLKPTQWQPRLSFGLDGFRDRQEAAFGGQDNPVIPKGEQAVIGAYVQGAWQPDSRWSMLTGLRLDRYRTKTEAGSWLQHQHVSPKMTLSYQLAPQWQAWGSLAEAYRTPSLSETHMNLRCDNCLFNFAPNLALKPEIDRSLELGINHWGRDWLQAGDRLMLRASMFHSRTRDLISNTVVDSYSRRFPFDGEGLVFQYQNQTRTERTGIEAALSWRWAPWQVDLGYSRLRVRDRQTRAHLFAPPDKLVANIGWQQGEWKVHWRARWVAAQSYDSIEARRTVGYSTQDLWLQWTPIKLDGLALSLGGTNLGDKRYVVYQTDNPSARTIEAGRAWKLAAGWIFR